MFCNKCGAEIADNSKFCSECVEHIEVVNTATQENNENAMVEVVEQNNNENSNQDSQIKSGDKKLSWKALVGMIVSLSGLIFAGIVCGIVGIVFSCLGKSDVAHNNKSGKGMAIAGLVVGILDIVFGTISIFTSCITFFAMF